MSALFFFVEKLEMKLWINSGSYNTKNISYMTIDVEYWLTCGMKAIGWQGPTAGSARRYLDRFPKKRYIGQADAWPNCARHVASDQNIMPAITLSSWQSSSHLCFIILS